MPTISLFRNSIAENYQKSTGYSLTEGEAGEARAYTKARNLILKHMGVDPSKVEDFLFAFRSQTASFTDPVTGDLRSVSLPAIKDQNVQKALEKYYDISGARQWQTGAVIVANSKGDDAGFAPLQRNTSALQKLSTKIDQKERLGNILLKLSSPAERNMMARRFLFLDHFRGEWLKKINEKIDARTKIVKSPTLPDAQMIKFKKELQDLQSLKAEIESIDQYALYHVLESFPLQKINQASLDEIAEAVRKKVLSDIKPTQWRGIRSAPHSKEDYEYAADVAGMLYLDRDSYYKFCGKNRVERKREGMADVFIREALQFAKSAEGNYSGEGFEDSVHLNKMNQELKKEMQDDLHVMSLLASHSIPHSDLKEYETDAAPADQTKEAEKEFNKKQLEKLQGALEKQKQSIKTGLKISDIPPPPVEEPGARSLIRTGLEVVAAGTVAVGAGLLAGVIDPSTAVNLAQYIQNNPGRMIASISLIDTFRNKAVTYIAPIERNPDTGRLENKINYKRLAIVGGTAAVMALMGAAMYNAVNDGEETGSLTEHAGNFAGMILTGTAQAVNYVWNNTSVPVSHPITMPGTNITWGGTVPLVVVVQAAGALNRIPYIGSFTKPIHRAVMNVAVASQLIPIAKWGYDKGVKGYEVGEAVTKEGAKRAKRYIERRSRAINGFARVLWNYMSQRPLVKAIGEAAGLLSEVKGPLSIM